MVAPCVYLEVTVWVPSVPLHMVVLIKWGVASLSVLKIKSPTILGSMLGPLVLETPVCMSL